MNGGNKIQIFKDGFGDIYSATADEEALWAKDVIAIALAKIDSAENATTLAFAVERLVFHEYPNLQHLILDKLKKTSTTHKIVLATALWNNYRYNQSFDIIYQNFLLHQHECLDHVFHAIIDFKGNKQANLFCCFVWRGKMTNYYGRHIQH